MKKKYQAVYVRFLDHAFYQNQDPIEAVPILCESVGILWKEDETALYLIPWICNGNLRDANNEVYVILKSTITKRKVLR